MLRWGVGWIRLAVWSAALASAGCGRLGFTPGEAAPDATTSRCATATFANPGASTMTDDFTTGMLTDLWAPTAPCIAETGGELVATPPDDGTYCHAWTNASFHLSCDSLTLEVPEATAQVNGAQTFIYIDDHTDPTKTTDLILEADFVFAGSMMADEIHLGGFDPVADRWWRLEERDGVLSFSTSSDGQTWRPRGSIADPMSFDDIQIALGAGTWQVVANPGRARFHCYNLSPPCT